MGAINCPIIPMGAIDIGVPAKDIRLLGKFRPESFKTERLVCVDPIALKLERKVSAR